MNPIMGEIISLPLFYDFERSYIIIPAISIIMNNIITQYSVFVVFVFHFMKLLSNTFERFISSIIDEI